VANRGRTRSQPAERGTAGQGRGDVLDIGSQRRLPQTEALSKPDARGLHQIGHELVLDALSDDHRPGDTCEGDLIKAEIIQHVDHHNLNTDVAWLEGRIPTGETLELVFFERLRPHIARGTMHAARVWETKKSWAECTRGD
jgi:6-pyruvoyl tetrahydropterin synthase